jgi:ketosteroid isomerase-like protein
VKSNRRDQSIEGVLRRRYQQEGFHNRCGMYSPDALFIRGDGSMLVGKDAISKAIATGAPQWPQTTIESDSLRVVGNTAWDVGTSVDRSAGRDEVSRYLVVLRRGMKYWKISALAVVPVTADSAPPAKVRVSSGSQ